MIKIPEEVNLRTSMKQEGRAGYLLVSKDQLQEISKHCTINVLFEQIDMQVFKVWETRDKINKVYYGYCPLFYPMDIRAPIPTYTMEVDFSEKEPVIQTFKQEGTWRDINGNI